MTAPSPPMVGEDCLEGVKAARAAQGLFHRLLDFSCLPIRLILTLSPFIALWAPGGIFLGILWQQG